MNKNSSPFLEEMYKNPSTLNSSSTVRIPRIQDFAFGHQAQKAWGQKPQKTSFSKTIAFCVKKNLMFW